jgi:inorganic pyrophosphatase
MSDLPDRVRVLIEVPRFSFVKREAGGGVDFVSPVPCPFNYGCVPGARAPDGDPPDALVLGSRVAAGVELDAEVWAVVRFVDDDVRDDKLVCGARRPSDVELAAVGAFFRVYARARAGLNALAGRQGRTAYEGVERRG